MRLLLNENGSITFVITQVIVKRDRKNLFTIILSRYKLNIHFSHYNRRPCLRPLLINGYKSGTKSGYHEVERNVFFLREIILLLVALCTEPFII